MGLCGIGEGIVGCGLRVRAGCWVAVSALGGCLRVDGDVVMYGIVLAMAVGRGSMRMLVMTALQL
jgi:hypothetical protein